MGRLTALNKYTLSLAFVALASGIGLWVHRELEPTNLVMVYLLAVVLTAAFLGRGPAILASFLSVLAFDVLFVPPKFSITVYDAQYLVTFAGLLIVGLVISELTSRIREKTIRDLERERNIELMKEKEKLQTALLSSISHDLRTPLVSITGALSSLSQDVSSFDPEARKDLIDAAYEETVRFNRLVGNLLDMARVEAGALRVHSKLCDLRDLIGSALHQLDDRLEKRQVQILIPKEMPEIPADFTLLMRVFVNLIDNAVKYSPSDSPIRVSAKLAGDWVRIGVKDEGFGVPKEDLKRIFGKFYRAVKPRQITGTGLGLSICKGIVEAHGGEIWAENNPDKGATFVVSLPLAEKR